MEHRAKDKVEAAKLRAEDKANAEIKDRTHFWLSFLTLIAAVAAVVVSILLKSDQDTIEITSPDRQITSPVETSKVVHSSSQNYTLPSATKQIQVQALCKVPLRC